MKNYLLLVLVLAPLLAGAVYVLRFAWRVIRGERMKPSDALNPVAPDGKVKPGARALAGLLPLLVAAAFLFWWYVGRNIVGPAELTIDAGAINDDFARSEVAGFAKYNGKTVRVLGIYAGSGVSFNEPWLAVQPDRYRKGIWCSVQRGDAETIAAMKIGDRVTVRGTVKNFLLGIVSMHPCVIEQG